MTDDDREIIPAKEARARLAGLEACEGRDADQRDAAAADLRRAWHHTTRGLCMIANTGRQILISKDQDGALRERVVADAYPEGIHTCPREGGAPVTFHRHGDLWVWFAECSDGYAYEVANNAPAVLAGTARRAPPVKWSGLEGVTPAEARRLLAGRPRECPEDVAIIQDRQRRMRRLEAIQWHADAGHPVARIRFGSASAPVQDAVVASNFTGPDRIVVYLRGTRDALHRFQPSGGVWMTQYGVVAYLDNAAEILAGTAPTVPPAPYPGPPR